jgi:hypothetical protein
MRCAFVSGDPSTNRVTYRLYRWSIQEHITPIERIPDQRKRRPGRRDMRLLTPPSPSPERGGSGGGAGLAVDPVGYLESVRKARRSGRTASRIRARYSCSLREWRPRSSFARLHAWSVADLGPIAPGSARQGARALFGQGVGDDAGPNPGQETDWSVGEMVCYLYGR